MEQAWPGPRNDPLVQMIQLLARLTTRQDVWSEAGKALVRFWGADLVALGERRAGKEIDLRHCTFGDPDAGKIWSNALETFRRADPGGEDSGSEMREAMAKTLESGVPTARRILAPEPLAVAFMPVIQKERATAVLVVGHRASVPLLQERLDVYLAVAGLVGTTAARLAMERELEEQHRRLEALVQERTVELAAANERLEREIAERVQAEETLRESERMLNAAGKMGKIGGWEHDLATGKAVWTQALYDIIEIPYDQEPPGVDEHLSYYPPGGREILESAYNQAVQKGIPFDLELQVYTAQKKLIWCRAQGEPVYENGTCVAMRGVFQDITERKRAEDAWRDAEARSRGILDAQIEMVILYDRALQIVWPNQAACESAGLPRSELIGRHCYEIWAQRASPCPDCPILKAIETGQPHTAEKTTPNGRSWLIRGYPLRTTDGEIVGGVEVTHDCTERKRAEEEIESLAKFPSENPNPVLRIDQHGLLLYANEATFSLLSEWDPVVGQAAPQALQALVQEAQAQRVRAVDLACGERVFSFAAAHLPEAEYVNVYARDITPRVRAEKALQEYAGRLEEMVEERTTELRTAQEQLVRREKLAVLGQLAGGVGHDLRNPLGVISNAVYLIRILHGDGDPMIVEYLGLIDEQVRAASDIVGDLLDFARTRAPERQAVDVRALIDGVLLKQPPPEGVTVMTDVAPGLAPAWVDPRQIERALANLVTNAYQAMPEGGQLSVRVEQTRGDAPETDHWMRIAVVDSGSGISPEHMARLFEPLFTTKARGIGLGLATCRNLVEANGGRIEVHSEVRRGSTFDVWLPARESVL
jgi:PAS domain S-box-containing protein